MSREPQNVDMLDEIDSEISTGTVRDFWVDSGMFHRVSELYQRCVNRGMDMSEEKFTDIIYKMIVDYMVKGRVTKAPEDTPRPSRWWSKTL